MIFWQGESGICSVTGTEDSPSRVELHHRYLYGDDSIAILSLIQRGRTGDGIDISISMFDVMADWMNTL